MSNFDFNAEYVKGQLNYEPETGVFTWRVQRGGTASPGSIAGSRTTIGYTAIALKNRKYYAHRLAWLYMTGEWPIDQIDHKDGCRTNNKWENLRSVSQAVNNQNQRRPYKRNTTGFLGVTRAGKRFLASVRLNGKNNYFGTFDTAEMAHAAYLEGKRKLHPGNTL